MINFKNIIAEEISKITNIEINEISKFIEVPKESENGDYAFPCFKLAKTLKKSPNLIADDLKLNINIDLFLKYIQKNDLNYIYSTHS